MIALLNDERLHINHFSLRYQGMSQPLIDDLSIELTRGRIHCLIGLSGSGKSSLLKALMGIEPQIESHFDLQGLSSLLAADKGEEFCFGLVPQSPLLLSWLNVRNNILLAVPRSLQKTSGIQGRVDELLEAIHLREWESYFPHELSLGMQARVAFARTLVSSPQAILLDEPFAALDGVTRLHLQRWLAQEVHKRRLWALLVTHDLDEILNLGGDVSVLGGALPRHVVAFFTKEQLGSQEDPKGVLLAALEQSVR